MIAADMVLSLRQFLLATFVFLASALACFSQDEDDELVPGVLLRLSTSNQSVERIVDSLAFNWSHNAPDPRLPNGSFSAELEGQLLFLHDGITHWHAYGQGKVEVEVAGRKVLSGERDQVGWISSTDAKSTIGVQPFKVRFERSSSGAELQLFWSSESFGLEPLPAHVLFHAKPRADLQQVDKGSHLFAAYRCGQCHVADAHSARLASPDLRFTKNLGANWLRQQVAGQSHDTRMPSFDLNEKEQADVVAFLNSKSLSPMLDAIPKAEKKRTDELDRVDGLILLKSVGCLACHVVDGIGVANEFGGPDLTSISTKRSADWLFTWFIEPERLNPQHRMPTIRLSPLERRQLALALSSLKPVESPATESMQKGSPKRGQDILTEARCVACHNLPGVDKPVLNSIPTLAEPVKDWDQSCLASASSRSKWRPTYAAGKGGMSAEERSALRAYVSTLSKQSNAVSLAERGRAITEAKNCLSCHPRGTHKGLAAISKSILASEPALAASAPTLIPPNLTAVGDKLLDEALKQSISGEQQVRKSWLKVRMPKFEHSDNDKAAIVSFFVSQDRIPDSAPGSQPATSKVNELPVDDQTLLLGQTLVGPKGFSCIACHQMGSHVPKNVAIGTRGSDLLTLRSRMREPFFHRWVHAPLRIVPGMEMPSYGTRPVKGILNDNPKKQFDTLWRTLNDSRFQPPTDIGSVEQLVFVEPDQPARIIRDVFTNSEANGGGYIARAFAIGFNNQHNVLIDLDSLTLRGWTFGDLARQRTAGKSWYWDMAASAVIPMFSRDSDYLLIDQDPKRAKPLTPTKEFGTVGKLVSYRPYQAGIEFVFDLNFTLNNIPAAVRVTEHLTPRIATSEPSSKSGFDRRITVTNIPTGFDLLLARPKLRTTNPRYLGQPSILRDDEAVSSWLDAATSGNTAESEYTRFPSTEGTANATLRYEANLKTPSLAAPTKPLIQSATQRIESTPGFDGIQLPLDQSIMPTAMTFLPDGTLAFTSLKGHVYIARDTDKDGIQDSLQLFEEGLAAPYGIIADGDSLIVAHKPELIRLRDTDGDGRADERTVFASGWGFNDNYHDWTCGIIRDSKGNFFVGTGSDYSQPGRPLEVSRWRGKVLRVTPAGEVQPIAHAFRYPTGFAIDSRDRIFASDNQGEQNCFNEINHIQEGHRYGVESLHERKPPLDPGQPPAIQVPHPWTRSVNGLVILPASLSGPAAAWAGHGLGCEYNTRFLVRFTYQEVDGVLQGAVFPFSKPNHSETEKSFLGPISIAATPNGNIYVGSIHDSGWLGGLNVGSIVKLTAASVPQGLKDIRATADGLELAFFHPVDSESATSPKNYAVSGYTRSWQGTYETQDSNRYQPTISAISLSKDRMSARLRIDRLKVGYVYEINCANVFNSNDAWPTTGTFTLHKQPK